MDSNTVGRHSLPPNRVSNDSDNVVQQSGPSVAQKIPANPPVIKSSRASPKSIWNRFIQIVKPQFMRRLEVNAIWKKADLKMYEFVQAVTWKKEIQVVRSAMDEVFSTLAPLAREKEGTPDITRLVGSRMLKQIRTMDLNELDSLATNLNNVWQTGRDDSMGLFLYSVRATILHKQAYAIQKEVDLPLFKPGPSIKAWDLSLEVLQKLADLHDDAQALIKPTEGFKQDEVLPGTQLKLNRLLTIEYWAKEAKKDLEARKAQAQSAP